MIEIVQKENSVLRKKAKEVPKDMFGKMALKKILRDMKVALESQEDGIAIAAPQIGLSYRIFIVSPLSYQKESKNKPLVFINPKISKLSKEKELLEEGCLSARWLYGKVERHKKASVRAQDENGKLFERGGTGLLAQIFQHETDHLEGVLFVDKAKSVIEVIPEKKKKK